MMTDRKLRTFEGWTYYAIKTDEPEEWLTDVLHQMLIDNRPGDKETLEKITDIDGPL